MQPCSLLSLATAVPPHIIEQPDAKSLGREAFGGRPALFDRLSTVFDNAGIARRHIVAPQDWYRESHGWRERNALYLEACEAMFAKAASAAIEKAGLEPDQIDGVVMVSTTGIATPSLEARVGPNIGLRDDVRRVPVFGLGCAGGVNGLSLAAKLASADPGSYWLFVTDRDLLDLDPPRQRRPRGGGRHRALRRRRGSSGRHQRRAQPRPDQGLGREAVAQHAADHGLGGRGPGSRRRLRRAIPPFIEAELAPAVDEMCAKLDIERDSIHRFCCDPGGVKVIDAIESALHLNQGELNLEREVLHDYGNMSAPTVMFVLDRLLEQGLPIA